MCTSAWPTALMAMGPSQDHGRGDARGAAEMPSARYALPQPSRAQAHIRAELTEGKVLPERIAKKYNLGTYFYMDLWPFVSYLP